MPETPDRELNNEDKARLISEAVSSARPEMHPDVVFSENGIFAESGTSETSDPVADPESEPESDELEEDDFHLEARDYRPIRFRRDGKLGCLGGLMYAAFVICIAVILAVGGWMAATDVLALGKTYSEAVITIPAEAISEEEQDVTDDDGKVTGTKTVSVCDIDYVANSLKDNGIIEYKSLFKLFAKISHADKKIDAGIYHLNTNLDYRALIKNMQVGAAAQEVIRITFPEGFTMRQIFERLEDEGVCSGEDLYYAVENFSYSFRFLDDSETGDPLRLEGFLFPSTYDFYQGEQASSVINKFLTALHYRMTAEMYTKAEDLGLSFREVLIVASMIEKEAANDVERATIASVIYNRLHADMELGIDSTILYEFPDYTGGVDIPDEIMDTDSPYNTNLNKGLPPSPICNPGLNSIKAALNPAAYDYYYYALDAEAGTHRFFKTYDEFAAFVATQNYGNG